MIDHGFTKSGRVDAAPTQSPAHGEGRTGRVCRKPSWASPPVPFSTGPTVAALPAQARIVPSRPSPSEAGRWSRIRGRPAGTAHCYPFRRCRFRRIYLGSEGEDSDADVRPSRCLMRSVQ